MNTARVLFEGASKGNIAPLPWQPLVRVAHARVTERQIVSLARSHGVSMERVRTAFDQIERDEVLWTNDTYQVSTRDFGDGWRHLSIKRIDQQPVHDWRDLQRIKNQLLGEQCEAVEIYPAEERRVDAANQYHLWGSTDPTYRLGLGFHERAVADDKSGPHGQRPLEPENG